MDAIDYNEVQTLCRICLTKRPNMTPLDSPFSDEFEQDEAPLSIVQMLEQVMSQKVVIHEKYPSFICSTCKNLLKVAHEFNVLFHDSQASLTNFFKNEKLEGERTDVELIFAGYKFDIKDVVVEEEIEEDSQSFEGFLNNLGSAVTAVFVKKATCVGAKLEENAEHNNHTDAPVLNLNNHFMCPHCDTISATKAILANHLLEIHHALLNVCKTCGLKTSNSECKKCSQKQYLCDICGHVNKTAGTARTHRQTHEGKLFECHICHKKFSYKISLNLHIRGHANVRNHLCTLCGKTFFYSNALVYHMRMHTNDRIFKCDYCDKTFYMKSSLTRHTRTHTGDRPYVCAFCSKGFRSNGEKRKHEMIHTGDRPYKCRFCPKTFTSRYNQLMHHMAHRGPHECDQCGRSFIEVEFLKRHHKNKHSTEEINVKT